MGEDLSQGKDPPILPGAFYLNYCMVGQVTFRSCHSKSVSLDIRGRINVPDMVDFMSSWSRFCIHLPPLIHWLRSHTALPREIIVTECHHIPSVCWCSTTQSVFRVVEGKVYFWGLLRALCRMRTTFCLCRLLLSHNLSPYLSGKHPDLCGKTLLPTRSSKLEATSLSYLGNEAHAGARM